MRTGIHSNRPVISLIINNWLLTAITLLTGCVGISSQKSRIMHNRWFSRSKMNPREREKRKEKRHRNGHSIIWLWSVFIKSILNSRYIIDAVRFISVMIWFGSLNQRPLARCNQPKKNFVRTTRFARNRSFYLLRHLSRCFRQIHKVHVARLIIAFHLRLGIESAEPRISNKQRDNKTVK